MSKLKLEVLFGAVDKLTGPMKTIVGGSKTMADALKKTDSELKNMQATQRKVDSFRGLQSSITKTSDTLARYRTEHRLLKEQSKLGPLSEDQTKKLKSLEAGILRTKSALKSKSAEITGVVRDLNVAGIKMDDLGQSESDLKNKIHLTTMELNKQKEALGKHAAAQKTYEKWQNRMEIGKDVAQKGLMVAGAGAAALAVPVKLSIDFESAMADVKKVVDFDTPQQFKQMENDIISMSTRLPMAAKDIAAIYAAGGQSGIAKNELTQFAETAVKMGVAFDISAEESGQAMAEMRTSFKMSQADVTTLADKINYLGNNTPAAAKGIMDIVQRIGPLGDVGGFASGSIAALGATIRGMGVAEEVAATGIKNMMLALVAGESATKSQKAAYKDLGLDSKKVAQDMQKDAEGTTLSVLKAISKMDKYKQAAMLKELFGSESLGSIAPLLTNMQALEDNLGKVADKSKYAGSMEKEYAARAETTANNLALAKNAMVALGITIGNQLLPGVNSITEKFTTVIKSVQAWSQANPVLSSTLVKIAVGAIAIVGGLSALSLGAIAVFGPMMMVAKGFSVVTGALNVMRIALLANPIMLIIAGIALAAFLIYKNWGAISGFFSNLWANVKTSFSNGISAIVSKLGIWKVNIVLIFNNIMNWIKSLPAKFMNFGAMIIDGLKNGILSKVNAVKDAITGAVSGVIDKAKGILGIHSPSRVFMGIGGYTMQGMANGIAQANSLPMAAMNNVTNSVIDAAQPQPFSFDLSSIISKITPQTKPQVVNQIAEPVKPQPFSFDLSSIISKITPQTKPQVVNQIAEPVKPQPFNFDLSSIISKITPQTKPYNFNQFVEPVQQPYTALKNTAITPQPVKPIAPIHRSNAKSFVSNDTIEIHIQVKDGSVVKGTAEAMRQELQRVAEEQQMKKRKFLTDTE